jgi:hypothetical protein
LLERYYLLGAEYRFNTLSINFRGVPIVDSGTEIFPSDTNSPILTMIPPLKQPIFN